MRHAALKPGRFSYHNPLVKLDQSLVGDVFRDEAGAAPEQITFDVAPEHLALIPHLAVRWDEARMVPFIDPDAPYGAADLEGSMRRLLAGQAAGQGADLNRLHHAMQPALQIFLRYADIVGRERVIAGVDCGFGTAVRTDPMVVDSIVWAKLAALSEGAKIASGKLWRS